MGNDKSERLQDRLLRGGLLASLVLFSSSLISNALASVEVAPTNPQVGFCAPFGFGTLAEPGDPGNTGLTRPWAPYAIYVYRNIPAFDAKINDTIAFDLGAMNDFSPRVEIALANGPDNPASGIYEENLESFVPIASNLVAGLAGNNVIGDYDAVYSFNQAFTFDGGTLLIRIGNPGVAYQQDDTCTGNLVYGQLADSSGFFFKRIIRADNATYPYGTETFSDNTGIPAFRIDTGDSADLSVSLSGTTQALLGDDLQFVAGYFNLGPGTASQVELSVELSPNVSFVSASPANANCSADGTFGATVTCSLGDVGQGGGANITIDATASLINSSIEDITATITAAENDPDTDNNTETLRLSIDALEFEIEDSRFDHFDRAIPFTGTLVGASQTHSVIVRNLSTVDQGITILNQPGLPFAFRDPNDCEIIDISNECELFVDFSPTALGSFNDTLSFNVYAVNSAELATVEVAISGRGIADVADLAISKTVDVDSVTPGASGSDLATFTLEVTNNGPGPAAAVVTDVLPDGLSVVPGMEPPGYDAATGIWETGQLEADTSASLEIPTIAAPGIPACVTNTATVALAAGQTVTDDVPANNTDEVSLGASGCADLQLVALLSDNLFTDRIGGSAEVTVELELRVTNLGPTTATNVTLNSTLGDDGVNLSFDDCNTFSSCEFELPNTDLGDIAAGESVSSVLIISLGDEGAQLDVFYGYAVSASEPDISADNNAVSGNFVIDPPGSGPLGSSGCFIATAAYGSYLEPEVRLLRDFRDEYLLTNAPGRAFVDWYYATSPKYADIIAANGMLRRLARIALSPLVYGIKYPLAVLAILLLALVLLLYRRSWHAPKYYAG